MNLISRNPYLFKEKGKKPTMLLLGIKSWCLHLFLEQRFKWYAFKKRPDENLKESDPFVRKQQPKKSYIISPIGQEKNKISLKKS